MDTQPEHSPRLITQRESLWAVFKPSGVAVHPMGDPTIPDLLTWAHEALDCPGKLAPIHRLDRGTSGVVLLSEDPKLRAEVGRWFADGEVKKTYLALVIGRARRKGVVRRALSDGRRGKPLAAVTRYRCIEQLGGFSLLRVRPETGRKHQIRRHLQHIGLPIVGDERYPPRRFVPVPAFPDRLWLHAHRLALPDGFEIETPLPPELEAHLEVLRQSDGPGA